ncbi:MAG: adenylate/guanylate cyclase domain-containing protein, partial [Candidatus Dormibacteraeota bacterium]|nr:adenylate/guanylate cyclase domain-containing protein [Candidatus Dormibacteraeota bacterium]
MSDLPTGTVTFLFTDIQGSTRLIQELGDGYTAVHTQHNELLRTAIADHHGRELRTEGDSFFAVFASAVDAVCAAEAGQRALKDQPWPSGVQLRVRMGVHTGEATVVGNDYVGLDVHRGARVAGAAHGGQVL